MAATGPVTVGRDADPGVAFLAELEQTFLRAADAVGRSDHELVVGGLGLSLSFAGAAMRDALLPPLAHLTARDRAAPELAVSVFETAETGVAPPELPWRPPPAEPGTNPVFRYESESCCVLAAAATGALTAVDLDRGTAIFHLGDLTTLPANERAAPLREALHLLLGRRDRWMAHAGAAGVEGHGALLVGRSGSGKSTLALSCARAGMEIAADDYVVLDLGPPPVAHALQSTAKLTARTAELLGVDSDAVSASEYVATIESAPKAEVPIETIAAGALVAALEVTAVIAPTVAGLERPRLEPITAAQGLQALAPSTLIQMRSRGASALPALAALARSVPSYSLALSTDVGANAEVVARVVGGDV